MLCVQYCLEGEHVIYEEGRQLYCKKGPGGDIKGVGDARMGPLVHHGVHWGLAARHSQFVCPFWSFSVLPYKERPRLRPRQWLYGLLRVHAGAVSCRSLAGCLWYCCGGLCALRPAPHAPHLAPQPHLEFLHVSRNTRFLDDPARVRHDPVTGTTHDDEPHAS